MRKYLLPSAIILIVAFGAAIAQNITKSIQQSQSPGAIGLDTSLGAYFPNHINSSGKSPAASLSATVAGSDFSGTITEPSNSIGTVLTFATAFNIAPHCIVTHRAPGVALATPISYTTSTVSLTITHLSMVSQLLDYICVGGT